MVSRDQKWLYPCHGMYSTSMYKQTRSLGLTHVFVQVHKWSKGVGLGSEDTLVLRDTL